MWSASFVLWKYSLTPIILYWLRSYLRTVVSKVLKNEKSRAENFRMMDIEINGWSSPLLDLETNLILYLYPEKCIKLDKSESCIRSRKIWNFARHLRIIYKKGGTLSYWKTGFLIFLYSIPKKSGLGKKLKVSTLDIRIKQSGLKVSHFKVPSAVYTNLHPDAIFSESHLKNQQ